MILRVLMQIAALLVKTMYKLCKILPLKHRVAFLSRQNNGASLDCRLLIENILTSTQIDYVICATTLKSAGPLRHSLSLMQQVLYAATSSIIVVEGYVPAVSIPKKRHGIAVIQLWHALGAIKKFGYSAIGTSAGRSTESARIYRMHRNYDYIIAGGPGTVDAYAKSFGYSRDVIMPLGLPQLDYLRVQTRKPLPANLVSFLGEAASCKPTVALYAPTLRANTRGVDWLNNNIRMLSHECKRQGIRLAVAQHPLTKNLFEDYFSEMDNVLIVRDVKTIDMLPYVDAVITDYSAIAFSAGIVGKPVFFFVPDINEYRLSPGLFIDPLEDFPGCSSMKAAEVIDNLVYDLQNCTYASRSSTEFLRFCEFFFKDVMDGHCANRISQVITDILEENIPRNKKSAVCHNDLTQDRKGKGIDYAGF